MISAAPYRDRVVHHALCNIIEPVFEKSFIFDTYANRKGKGSHAAIHRCQDYLRQYKYYLKTDIRKYFPSIDHQILKQVIRQKIGCTKTLQLIDLIIDNSNPQEFVGNYFEGDTLFTLSERRKGLPMGNLTSQYFANIYLTDFDHFVKEELGVPYIRYVDDFVLFHDDKAVLHELNHRIIRFLSDTKRLLLHDNKTIIAPSERGITFLGQRIFQTHRLLKKVNIRRFYKKLKAKTLNFKNKLLTTKDLETSLNAWVGHAVQADTHRLREKIKRKIVFGYGLDMVVSKKGAWLVLG